jgi:DNA-binding GntR family transcriptional regulator
MRRRQLRKPRQDANASADEEPVSLSLVERVYGEVVERILAGRLAAGDVLSELGLAAELGVSRTPVHEALALLVADGLVTRERNCRARVARFSGDDLFEVFEMRKLLEGHAAELAAGRMDSRQLGPLRATAAALREGLRARDWSRRWSEADEEFHRTIAQASGNARLAADILRYRLLHRGINRHSTDPKSLQSALAEHESILDALDARDAAAARARMVAHIAAWQEFFADQLRRSQSSGGRKRLR